MTMWLKESETATVNAPSPEYYKAPIKSTLLFILRQLVICVMGIGSEVNLF